MFRLIHKVHLSLWAFAFFRFGVFCAENPSFRWSAASVSGALQQIFYIPQVQTFLNAHGAEIQLSAATILCSIIQQFGKLIEEFFHCSVIS